MSRFQVSLVSTFFNVTPIDIQIPPGKEAEFKLVAAAINGKQFNIKIKIFGQTVNIPVTIHAKVVDGAAPQALTAQPEAKGDDDAMEVVEPSV